MSTLRELTIETATEAVGLPRYTLTTSEAILARTPARSPYGTTWFAIGDGEYEASELRVDAHVIGTTLEESIGLLTEVMRVARDATIVRWGEFRRPVAGLSRVVRSPVIMGYRVSLFFIPTGAAWLDEHDGEVWL